MSRTFINTTFGKVYPDSATFEADYAALPEAMKVVKDTSIPVIYYLLAGRYFNNQITNKTEELFKNKLFTVIFMYGPTWEKRLDIQSAIRDLDLTDIKKGTQAIYNTAINPGDAPSTGALTELEYINQQNTTNYNKSDLDAYAQLWDMLETDVTKQFLDKFNNLFIKIPNRERMIFINHDLLDEEEEDDE